MEKLIKLIFATAFLFQSCGNGDEKKITEKINKKDTLNNVISNKNIVLPETELKYSIIVEQIDSIKYNNQKKQANHNQDKIEKITDFETAKKMLKNIVFFNNNDADGQSQAILKIRFRNGKENIYNNDFDYFYFVAYYPTEDILLCEGGHTTDISFNLKNGNETEEVGNPDYIKTSPNKLLRLNGHFGGQECSSYFIQEKTNNVFKKIVQLDEEFEKQTKEWLCIMGDNFWKDDNNFYFTLVTSYGEDRKNLGFYKIELYKK